MVFRLGNGVTHGYGNEDGAYEARGHAHAGRDTGDPIRDKLPARRDTRRGRIVRIAYRAEVQGRVWVLHDPGPGLPGRPMPAAKSSAVEGPVAGRGPGRDQGRDGQRSPR